MDFITSTLCMTKDIGVHNNLFGGIMLGWLDMAGAMYATKTCHTPNMVTVKLNEVTFKLPVKVNNHINFYGEVRNVGRTSITIYLEARKFNVYTRTEELVCSTDITFVRIDEEGKPIPISQHVKDKIEAKNAAAKN